MPDWYTFYRKDDERISYKVRSEILRTTTKYQRVEILETTTFGKALFLDGSLQSTACDEFAYHEPIVHPAMCLVDAPRRVFIAGGGEGAVLREVLKHPSVEYVCMADIDGELVDIAREHLWDWHHGAFDDPRARVVYEDAVDCLGAEANEFDVIIVDVTAPKAGNPGVMLYTQEFYQLARSHLTEAGVFVTQAQSTNVNNLECYRTVFWTLSSVFQGVAPSQANLASDGDCWGYILARQVELQPLNRDIDRILSDRGISDLRFYDGEAHQHMFSLPKYVRQALKRSGKEVSTANKPFVFAPVD